MKKRHTNIIRLVLLITVLQSFVGAYAQNKVDEAAAQAHHMIWTKFVNRFGLLFDYVGEVPTPFDCKLARPNAFGWFTPIENGTFFTGLYLIAICDKVKLTNAEVDRDKARILAQGLLRVSLASDVPGFIARGFSADGKTSYPIGSNDQTIPWYLGLYYYLKSDIPSVEEREIIKNKLVEVVEALSLNDWRFPSSGMFTGDSRDDLRDDRFLEVPCYLFLLRSMYELTHDEKWLRFYEMVGNEKPDASEKTRFEICGEGIEYDIEMWNKDGGFLWIYVSKQLCLLELAELEDSESMKSFYVRGLNENRNFVMPYAEEYVRFDNSDDKIFGTAYWRDIYSTWYPQFTTQQAIHISQLSDKEKIGERRNYERNFMTNPLAAASIIALAGNAEDSDLINQIVSHYNYSRLYLSEFFYAEFAHYRMANNRPFLTQIPQ